jgi:hypothetical protein
VLVGADSGVVDTNKKTASPGPIAFARSLPLQKAVADGTLLAYSMNEVPLTRDHGYPLRAVVGGWFGMGQVDHSHQGGGATVFWLLTRSEFAFRTAGSGTRRTPSAEVRILALAVRSQGRS